MGLHPNFPRDPHAVLPPAVRWYPGEESLRAVALDHLIPPLVGKIREGVWAWRESRYEGTSDTSKALLRWWFQHDHGGVQYYFGQREAVETAVWLYEVIGAHDPFDLLRFDASGVLSADHFREDWPRYVMKLATGAGKTKVMSLLMAWSYFHHLYEPDSTLANNILLIAPNIIVLDRLRTDFDGCRIFHEDPILPEDGHGGHDWGGDFQMTVHVQDEVQGVSDLGNLFLTNIHRVYEPGPPDPNDLLTSLFELGKPGPTIHSGQVDLLDVVKRVPNLLVLNDEAHHIHDDELEWAKSIRRMHHSLRQKGSRLSAQLDLSATPKHTNGAIFPQVVSDYPLVEAIHQGIVKTPVLPDEASRAKLVERQSEIYTEQYEDYLHLGYQEWLAAFTELEKAGKKAVLFVMTDVTSNCDEVGRFLEQFPELRKRVLVIHTNKNGEISESGATKKDLEELRELRQQAKDIDSPESPYRAIVSVMVLREGWDVQNVTTIVGLRPYKAKSKILPEQTLGRGLRRMFRGVVGLKEKVSVIGTEAFMAFVESIKAEGVELEYVPMGPKTRAKVPLLVEVDKTKDDREHEIEIPNLTPRVAREYKDLHELDLSQVAHQRFALRHYTEEERREIVFRDIATDEVSHVQQLASVSAPNINSAIGFFANRIIADLHLVGAFDILYGQVKKFIADELFEAPISLDDPNLLRNLSEQPVSRTLVETIKQGINMLTVKERGSVEVRNTIKMSRTRAFLENDTTHVLDNPKKSLLTRVVGDSHFEIEIASFLDECTDLISYLKTSAGTQFHMEYRNAEGGMSYYTPDFIVKVGYNEFWVLEAKGQEDVAVPLKWARLQQWCEDASRHMAPKRYRPLYVKYTVFQDYRPKSFAELVELCKDDQPA